MKSLYLIGELSFGDKMQGLFIEYYWGPGTSVIIMEY